MPEVLALLLFDGGPGADPLPVPGDGLLGASLWTGLGARETTLGLLHFADDTAATAQLRKRVESGGGVEAMPMPHEVHNVEIKSHHGGSLEGLAAGGYLTVARLLASPGYADEAGAWADETLEGIEALDGYAGHLRGVNPSLPDEVWALILWSSPPVLPPPPTDRAAHVDHYRRIR